MESRSPVKAREHQELENLLLKLELRSRQKRKDAWAAVDASFPLIPFMISQATPNRSSLESRALI